jgi:hypothetical protein
MYLNLVWLKMKQSCYDDKRLVFRLTGTQVRQVPPETWEVLIWLLLLLADTLSCKYLEPDMYTIIRPDRETALSISIYVSLQHRDS